jgi:Bacterial regulatory proteins, luxR family
MPSLGEQLTARELEVLRLIAGGRSNQRIARELFVSLDTAKKHLTHVLGKLGAAKPHRGRRAGPAARPDPLTLHPRPARSHLGVRDRRPAIFHPAGTFG